MNYYFNDEVWGRGYSSIPYWYPRPGKLGVNQKYLNYLIKRLSIESSEYWTIINGINNSVDEIIAWSGLLNKLKNIHFELYEDNLILSEAVKKVQQIRDEGLAYKDWDYTKDSPLQKTTSVRFDRDYRDNSYSTYFSDDDIPF
tara:strand:+ start:2666 stop:3094 length:429 start_codon:yes stop_codon:yes gene_type:complete